MMKDDDTMKRDYVVVNMYRNQVTIGLPNTRFDTVVYGKYDPHRFKRFIRDSITVYDIPAYPSITQNELWERVQNGKFDYRIWKTERIRCYVRRADIEDIAATYRVTYDSTKDKQYQPITSNNYGYLNKE